MSRFIKIPHPTNAMFFINSDTVDLVVFEPGTEYPKVIIRTKGKYGDEWEPEFKTDAEAIDFIEKNFLFFNK